LKALRLHGIGDLRMHDESVPRPTPEELLLRVTAVGVCGSDLHWYGEGTTGRAQLERPIILGHEFAGHIQTEDDRGKRVAVDPAMNCRTCVYCREGNPNLCNRLLFAGHADWDGALCEYVTWPRHLVHRLPDSMTDSEGVMLEPLGVALHALDLGKLRVGMKIGVFGCGPIGLLLVQLARLMGASQIFATDPLLHRLDAARDLGVTAALPASGGEEAAEILARTEDGLDVVFEAAGENAAVEAAFESARPGSRVVLIGIPSDDRTSFAASVARRKGLTIKLSRRMKHTYPRAIRLVESGRIDVASIVTHRFPLQEYEKAFRLAENREGLKVIIEP
jgi:L-iditol 2-dehydrogenase